MKTIKSVTNQDIIGAINRIGPYPVLVAEAVGLKYKALQQRIYRSTELQDAWNAKRESMLDTAEGVLEHHLKAKSLKAAMFVLRFRGKKRGYIGTQDEATSQGGTEPAGYRPDLEDVTDEQLRKYLARLAQAAAGLADSGPDRRPDASGQEQP